jgi:hypothetical protein
LLLDQDERAEDDADQDQERERSFDGSQHASR